MSARTRWYGYLRNGPRPGDRRVVLTVDDRADLAAALCAAEAYFGKERFEVWIDDRARAAALEPGLLAAGFAAPQDNTVVLGAPSVRISAGAAEWLAISDASDERAVRSWSRVKLMAFADEEAEPAPAVVDGEVAARLAEQGIARYETGWLDHEPVAVIGHYTATADRMVFLLGTRLPFRHRGVAQGLLHHWAARAVAEGARSLLINCDEHGLVEPPHRPRCGWVVR